MDLDIMLEVKDKNLSAVKCGLLAFGSDTISPLEREWAKYKYSVLEHSPKAYLAVRALLKNKNEFPAKQFYAILEQAMDTPIETNNAVNAALHVWGYFKQIAAPEEKKRFFASLGKYEKGMITEASVKNQLLKLAERYNEHYLLDSYYFL
jgi:UV DNA damage endonuclease